MTIKFIMRVSLLVTLVLAGCSNQVSSQEAEILFGELYENCSMNDHLLLRFVGPLYEGDRYTHVSLESVSGKSVIFPSGYNLQLLSFDGNQNKWIEVKNSVLYLPFDVNYIVGKNDPENEREVSLIPIKPNMGREIVIRAVVYGHIYENGIETDGCTGAFVDFEFSP